MRNQQRGITLIGFVMMMCVVGFFAYATMKLFPAYSENMGVVKAMNQLKLEPGVADKPLDQIRADLNVKFDLQFVDESHIPPQNIQLKKQGGASSLRIFYDRRIEFLYNVDLLVHFDKTVDLTRDAP
ncbi:MAG: DUF4845 domain-containing protein [Tahibacter sp.]